MLTKTRTITHNSSRFVDGLTLSPLGYGNYIPGHTDDGTWGVYTISKVGRPELVEGQGPLFCMHDAHVAARRLDHHFKALKAKAVSKVLS